MRSSKRTNFKYYCLFLINTFVIYFFEVKNGIICGWDLQFHLNRIEELSQSIYSGHLLSSNGSFAFCQIGLLVNKFYPYLFLYPFALLRGLINPVLAYNICLISITILSFIISYRAITYVSRSSLSGFFFSIIYNNSGYLLLQITQRGDIAEYIALALLPLLLEGFIGLIDNDNSLKWLWLPIIFILLTYDHLLSTILFMLFMIIMALFYWHEFRSKLIKLIISMGIVIVATLPVSLQIILTTHQNRIITPIVPDTLQNEALKPSHLFLYSLINHVPGPLSQVNVGIVVLLGVIFSIWTLKQSSKLGRQLGILGVVFLFLSTNLFPWFIFQHTIMHVLQFPWRFLGIATFCIAYAISVALQNVRGRNIAMIFFILINMVTFNYMHTFCHRNNQVIDYHSVKQYNNYATEAVYTDYMPYQTLQGINKAANFRKASDIHRHIALINGKKIRLSNRQIHPEYDRISYRLTNLIPNKKNQVTLPLLNYGKNYSKDGIKVQQSSKGTTTIIFVPSQPQQHITIYLR